MKKFKPTKKIENHKQIRAAFHMTADEHEKVKELAKANGLKINELVRQMVRYSLENMGYES